MPEAYKIRKEVDNPNAELNPPNTGTRGTHWNWYKISLNRIKALHCVGSELLNVILQETVEADGISILKYRLDNFTGNRSGNRYLQV